MKAKVKLSYSVELFVEAKDENQLLEWLNQTTPAEALERARENNAGYVEEDFSEEIICHVDDNSVVDISLVK